MNLKGLFIELVNLSLMGSILILVLLAIKPLLKRHISASAQYGLWFLVMARLILFAAPEHALSLNNLLAPMLSIFKHHPTVSQMSISTAPIERTDLAAPILSPTQTAIPSAVTVGYSQTHTEASFIDILAYAWLAGFLAAALTFIISNAVFLSGMRKSKPCKEPSGLAILHECQKAMKIRKNLPLLLSEAVKGPLLCGLTAPRLILPEGMLDLLGDDGKRYVFLHELTHYKRKDILVNYFVAFLKCLYWFNPLIHYAFRRMKEDCEISCDERVLKKIGPEERKSYGKTIISLMSLIANSYPHAASTALVQRQSCAKRRIVMIKEFRKRTALAPVLALLVTLLVGCSALTNAKSFENGNEKTANERSQGEAYKSLKPEGSLKPEESLKQEESLKSHEPLETNKIEDASEVKPTPEAKDMTVEEKVAYYMEKLKDKSFTGTYGDGQTWYTAAEELGMIGKPAIPKLIERLDTQDDYERALVLYALLLATQHDNVKTFTQGEYINVNLDFNAENHAEMVKAAKEWWEKYKSNF